MTTFVWPPLASGSAQESTQLQVLAAVDGVETLIGTTNTKLDTLHADSILVQGYVDGIETLVTSSNTKLDTLHADNVIIEGYVDGIETLIGTTNTNTADIKTAVDSTNTKLDTALTRLGGSFVNVAYDAMTYTSGATSDTYAFKTGGIAGTTVKTLVINYSDATKGTITNVAAT